MGIARGTQPGGRRRLLVVALLLGLVSACSLVSSGDDPAPSPVQSPEPEELRYDRIRHGFCEQARILDVLERTGLVLTMSLDPRRYVAYENGNTGFTDFDWWAATCEYRSELADDNRPYDFNPRGRVQVWTFSGAGGATHIYEIERGFSNGIGFVDDPYVEKYIDGWWDEAVHLEYLDLENVYGYGLTILVHIRHENLYLKVLLFTHVTRPEDTAAVTTRSRELVDRLIAETIGHVPLAGG